MRFTADRQSVPTVASKVSTVAGGLLGSGLCGLLIGASSLSSYAVVILGVDAPGRCAAARHLRAIGSRS